MRNGRKLTTCERFGALGKFQRGNGAECVSRIGGRDCQTALASPSHTTVLFVSITIIVYVTVPHCHINAN